MNAATAMTTDSGDATFFLVLRVIATIGFLITLSAMIYIARHRERIFGINPHLPSESSSDRSYAMFLVFAVLAHALVLTAAFALLLH
ncbi:MAG: hypothetical protein M3O82_00135 [Verrucomicrobiota bacterium]|nr:hypothetical protein [Verrucomicrobiota bacterium]